MVLAGNEEGMVFAAELQDLHTLVIRAGGNKMQSILLKRLHQSGVDLETVAMTFGNFYSSTPSSIKESD